jgi:hypothetical protein
MKPDAKMPVRRAFAALFAAFTAEGGCATFAVSNRSYIHPSTLFLFLPPFSPQSWNVQNLSTPRSRSKFAQALQVFQKHDNI